MHWGLQDGGPPAGPPLRPPCFDCVFVQVLPFSAEPVKDYDVPELWSPGFNDDVQRVKDASDIVRLIGEVVVLKPKGREYAGLCPFHDDHSPSMLVSPSKGIFKCFSCGTGGDVLSFVRKFHRMEFREALEFLAQRAGIELSRRPREAAEQAAGISRSDLLRASGLAAEYFRAILQHPEHGAAARSVVERRGIAPEMVTQFMLGASADRFDGLLMTARTRREDLRPFVETGLLREKETAFGGEGRMYDGFRHRLMFPIHDIAGRVVAFGARKIRDEDEPKYLNSPESRIFNKSATLYGLFQAARSIQKARRAVITEGYTDTIACHQAGLTNVVATLGTALTREHAGVLRRVCDEVVLLFDGDAAGQRAADRAVEVFFAEPLDVKIATLSRVTDAKDPDELLKREGGLATLQQALTQAVDLLEYRFARVEQSLAGAGLSARGRAVQEEIARLVELGLAEVEPIRRRMIVQALAKLARIDEATILAAIPAGRGARRAYGPRPAQSELAAGVDASDAAAEVEAKPSAISERQRIARGVLTTAEHLLGCVLCDPALGAALPAAQVGALDPAAFASPLTARVAGAVAAVRTRAQTPELAVVLGELEDDDNAQSAATLLAERIDAITDSLRDRLHAHWRACLQEIQREREQAAPLAAGNVDAARSALERLKQQHQQLGGNRRAFPKPNG